MPGGRLDFGIPGGAGGHLDFLELRPDIGFLLDFFEFFSLFVSFMFHILLIHKQTNAIHNKIMDNIKDIPEHIQIIVVK